MPDLAVLIPTRGRPGNVRKVISAWDFTNAWDRADMILVADSDDPEIQGYRDLAEEIANPDNGEGLITLVEVPKWMPMVHKLNLTAVNLAARPGGWPAEAGYFALGFAGDDHLPQTIGWAARYLTVLRELGSGMVYGDDGYQGVKLSTEWAITSDVVRALDRMVPADVEHMYCDNAMMDLFSAAGALRWLPEIRIEHFNPYAGGKAPMDDQYKRVNGRDQYAKDRRAYEGWRHGDVFLSDVAAVRHLRKGLPDMSDIQPISPRPRATGSGPRRLQRSGPSAARRVMSDENRATRPPRHFRNVRAATPEDVMTALADFATQVPADQEIVELGVFQGRTALQLAWGAGLGHGAHVTAIDPWDLEGNVYDPPFTDEGSRRWAEHWVSSFGYADKIRLVQAFSQDVAAQWQTTPDLIGVGLKLVGLLYVDGDHTKEGARRDIVSWAPHLAPGARIAVDDYGHPDWPGVGEAVDELVAEGFLEPIELFHDRLAVTRLADAGEPKLKRTGTATAITAEGVHPSPYPAVAGQAAVGPEQAPEKVSVEIPQPWADEEPVADPNEHRTGEPCSDDWCEDKVTAEPDSEVSSSEPDREYVSLGEAIQVPDATIGQRITELNTVQLRALAKARGIVLGVRKDKRDAMLQALKDGR
jgi:hypothetical protein